MTTVSDALEALHQRLDADRAVLVARVGAGEESYRGELAIVHANLGAVGAVLAQQQLQDLEGVEHPPGRVVITDAPEEPLWLIFYPADGAPVRASITPEKAVTLAAGLTAGALRRWPR